MAEMSHPEAEAQGLSQAREKDSRPVFEIGFHVLPTVEAAEVGGVVDKIRAELSKYSAEIIKEEFPTKRTLAYVVERSATGKREKYVESFFGFIKFAVESREAIPALEAMLRSTHEILRSLIIETERDEVVVPRRAVFTSDRLEGETIHKPTGEVEKAAEISEEELDKSIDALVS